MLTRWKKLLPGLSCAFKVFTPSSSSAIVILVISKDALELNTMMFGLKCAMFYSIPVLLVHDLVSCLFPNVAKLPSIYMVTKVKTISPFF